MSKHRVLRAPPYILALLLSCPVGSLAQQTGGERGPVRLLGGLALGSTSLQFDEKLDADASFDTYTLSASASLGKTYATLSYAGSFETTNISEEDEVGEASRQDMDITLGYRLDPRWTVFAGYKDGETEIDFTVRDTDIVQEEFYRENGFYAGASYAWRFEDAGSLSISAAYIRFDTDLQFTAGVDEEEEDEEEELEFDDLEGEFSGDSDGYSLGLSWVMPLKRQLAFRTQLKFNTFDLDVDADGRRFAPSQTLRYFDVGVLYAF